MTTVYIKEAVDDYFATAENGGRTVEHQFRLFRHRQGDLRAPGSGAKEGGDYLYVAYGVYGAHPAHGQRLPGAARLRHEGLEAFPSSRSRREVCIKRPCGARSQIFRPHGQLTRREFRTWPMIPRRNLLCRGLQR